MEKVYLIGAGHIDKESLMRQAKEILFDKELVFVDSIDEIPIEDRLMSDDRIRGVKHLEPPMIPRMSFEIEKPHKGHERPYKFHR